MIEVEKKFILTKDDEARLIEGAEFLGEETFSDTYYDTESFALTTKNIWLRKRGEIFELKVPPLKPTQHTIGQYQELTDEEEIRKQLAVLREKTFEEDLLSHGYAPLATIRTTRKKYERENFTIVLDIADYGYRVAEIEKIVSDESGIEKAAEEILAFARKLGFPISPVNGKFIEYLRRKSPRHWEALIAAGILTREGTWKFKE